MQSHNPNTILVVTKGYCNSEKIRALFPEKGSGKDILVARSWVGALEMARAAHPKLCLISEDMLNSQEHFLPDALKEACPDVEIFIAEESDLSVSAAQARMGSSH
jgi:hypothetical protein